MTHEEKRLREAREGKAPWKLWGPYLSERQWGTGRDDVFAVGEYDGDDPIVHVSGRFPAGSIVVDKHNGSVDHIAFRATGAVEFRAQASQGDRRTV
jgi:hypothetical protein